MNLIDMDRLRKELMAKGNIPIHEVFNTIWEQPIVKICKVEEQRPSEDCISRADAIKIFGEVHPLDYNKQSYIANIKKLPSVTPKPCEEENPNCTECRYYDKEKHHCPRFCRVIENTAVEITSEQERPTAHFVRYINHNYSPFDNSPEYIMRCSNCGGALSEGAFYCPNCGAKMEENE